MHLGSLAEVLATAEEVVRHIIGTYAEPNLTPVEIHSRTTNGEDPLRDFSEMCRAELHYFMQRQI
jgi:hypothetical protein